MFRRDFTDQQSCTLSYMLIKRLPIHSTWISDLER